MAPIKKYDLCVNIAKPDVEKAIWKTVGEVAMWDNGDGTLTPSVQIYTLPRLFVFEQRPRVAQPPLETHYIPETAPINVDDAFANG